MIQKILFMSVAILPFAASGAVLSVENHSTNAAVLVNKVLYPACVPHPGIDGWCVLPPNERMIYTLPGYANEKLTYVSMVETPTNDLKPGNQYIAGDQGRAYELYGAGDFTYQSVGFKTQRLVCNTLGGSGASQIRISIQEQFDQTCTGPDDQYVRWVDGRDDLDMKIYFNTTDASKN